MADIDNHSQTLHHVSKVANQSEWS